MIFGKIHPPLAWTTFAIFLKDARFRFTVCVCMYVCMCECMCVVDREGALYLFEFNFMRATRTFFYVNILLIIRIERLKEMTVSSALRL